MPGTCGPPRGAGRPVNAVRKLLNWLNVVGNKKDYLARLKMTIKHLHNCGTTWRESVPVHEVFRGETVWKGEVEVFDLPGHPKAKPAYGWSYPENADGTGERFVSVLEIPHVKSPETAVRASIVADGKKERKP